MSDLIERVKKKKLVQSILKSNIIPTSPKFNNMPINENDVLQASPDDLLAPHFEAEPEQKWRYPGERIICQSEGVSKSDSPIEGTFFLTNYRILFLPVREKKKSQPHNFSKLNPKSNNRSGLTREQWARELVNIPLTNILYYYGKTITTMDSDGPIGEIFFHSKILDYLALHIYPSSKTGVIPHKKKNSGPIRNLNSDDGSLKLEQYFQSSYSTDQHKVIFAAVHACLQNTKVTNLFAYSYRNRANTVYSPEIIEQGWNVYSPVLEFKRQKVTKGFWRISDANRHYQLCATYPSVLLVPKRISDAQLRESSLFRSSERIPILTWNHRIHDSFLCRSSQPRTGITRARSKEDEALIEEFRKLSNNEFFYIVDCRPKKNVWAMQIMGKGTEIDGNYKNAKVEYLGIENIHVMRVSIFELFELLQTTKYGQEGKVRFSSGRQPPPGSQQKNKKIETWEMMDDAFLTKLESCSWFGYCKSVLSGAIRVARYLEYWKASVLVHCSDGWDRTSQICSLTQVMLDPYYRTLSGFAVLIEKDWCGYGFKFQHRHGLMRINEFDDKNFSPIFIQFIDCVSYLWHEDPSQFEFNIHFLNYLVKQVYGSLFGNFLNNNEKDRNMLAVKRQTISIWTEAIFKEEKRKRFINHLWVERARKKRVIIPRAITTRKLVTAFFSATNIYGKNEVYNQMKKKVSYLQKELDEKNKRIKQLEDRLRGYDNY